MVQENRLKKIIIICGATATGKTALSIAVAKSLNGEIVSADSMNVYCGLDVGTAKPIEQERLEVPHHLIDVVSPLNDYSVSDYEEAALTAIDGIFERGKIPVICGGTGFYINSILYKMSYGGVGKSDEIRAEYERLAAERGSGAVYEVLEQLDGETARKLHPNDLKRVIRALEIYKSGGKKKSEQNDQKIPRYPYIAYAVSFPREELYARINSRVDLMIENGLFDEVQNLLQSGVKRENQCMQGIGYKEVVDGLINGLSKDEIAETIKINTRHYAKRQITFFKRMEGLKTLENAGVEEMAKQIIADAEQEQKWITE